MDGLTASGFGVAALDAVKELNRGHETGAGPAEWLAAACFAPGNYAEGRRALTKTRGPGFTGR